MKKKRKKRRKRRTPHFPRPLLRAHARRRQRQWHPVGFPRDVSPRAVFPSARHHGRYETEKQLRAPHVLFFLAILHLALCFFPCLQARDALHLGRYGQEELL